MDEFKTLGAVPVINTNDFSKAVDFYTGILGFEKVFELGQYAGLELGGTMIHLNGTLDEWSSLPTSARIDVIGVDVFYEKIRGVAPIKSDEPLQDMPFGVRQFSVLDPDGNRITFCQTIG